MRLTPAGAIEDRGRLTPSLSSRCDALGADYGIVRRGGGLVDDVEVGMTRLTSFVKGCSGRSIEG